MIISKFQQFISENYQSYLYSDHSDIQGKGLFTKSDIPSGSEICQVANLSKRDGTDNWVNEMGHSVNHSSNPNSRVEIRKDLCFLVSLRDILSGEEITTDYHNLPSYFNKTIYK
jgi:SET domain